MTILVTGANGFVGQAFCEFARTKGLVVRAAVRCENRIPRGVQTVHITDMSDRTQWSEALVGCSVVMHAAARVHIMDDQSGDPLVEFRKVNAEGTLNLARQAAAAGVRRFVFISSVKVNGEGTELGKPYTADDIPSPRDPYGISKLEAEQGLLRLAMDTKMEVTIIRPVLVYGPGVKANFLSMMKWIGRGVPLPLGAIHNKRSLVALDNLVDLVITCLDHPAAANQVFLVSDGEDLSTTELLRRMGTALGKPARLLPIPVCWLNLVASFVGKRNVAQRLCGSLQVDIGKTRQLLGWQPPLSVDEGLKKAVEGINR